MKSIWVVPYSILVGLLAVGILVLVSKPVRGEPIQLKPLPTPGPLMIHITGQVNQPGVYNLPVQSRLVDAVSAAGGFTDQADESKVNLAALLEDGQKILVPALVSGQVPVDMQGSQNPADGADPGVSSSFLYPLDLNTANQVELESLPEIGPKTALAILAYRQEHGPFKSIDELLDVPGIGSVTLNTVRDLVTVNP